MTPVAALLDALREQGVSVSLRADGKLWLQPKDALTPELLAALKTHRDALAALVASRSAEASVPHNGTDPKAEAHLAQLSPEAHTAFTGSANGAVEARQRQPNGNWSSSLTVHPPRFDTRAYASLPVCTGWCTGCGAPSTWRADPSPAPGPTVRHWHCVRCQARPQ